MDFLIRAFQRDDESTLKNIWLEFVQDKEGADNNIIPSKENAEKWMSFVKNIMDKGEGTLKLAIISGKIIGYIFYTWSDSPIKTKLKRALIYDLYVKPEFRNRGVGTALLYEAIDELKKKDVDFIQLTVISKNIPAIKLYKKFGFVETMKIMRLQTKD